MKFSKQEKLIIAGAVATSVVLGIVVFISIRNKKKKLTKLNPYQKKLKEVADADSKKWQGKKETDPEVSDFLIGYWKLLGNTFTPAQMQSPSFQDKWYWSSAYVSHLLNSAGFNFKPRSYHSTYTVDAKENRTQGTKNAFWAFRPTENKKVEVGDVLVKNRGGNNYTYDTIQRSVPAHGDVVVDFLEKDGKRYAVTQGGNVGNSVTKTNYELTPNDLVVNPTKFIAHLKYEK